MNYIPNKEELAWAAGFFDGEGCTHGHLHSKRRDGVRASNPRIAVTQSGPYGMYILQRFKRAVGNIGQIYGPEAADAPRQSVYRWQAGRFEHVQAVIALLWAWLSPAKQEQAATVFRYYHKTRRKIMKGEFR